MSTSPSSPSPPPPSAATSTAAPDHAWRWIPTLYFAQGIPYVVVMMLAVVMYKNLAISNTAIALYTSWLYLPWVIKPLWSPLVELFGRKRAWIVALQFTLGVALALVAMTLPAPFFFRATLAVLWLMAFASATHDIAADGFYLFALNPQRQAAFVGVRSTFYRLAMIAGQGGLVWLAGALIDRWDDPVRAWQAVFAALAGAFIAVAAWHAWALPRPAADAPAVPATGRPWHDGATIFAAFFRRPDIGRILAFLLLYRFAEAQLLKLVAPFLLDARDTGGLALTNQQVGLYYGTAGVIALTLGGLLGGWLVSRHGLRRLLWPLALALNVPNVLYVLLAATLPTSSALIVGALAVEQFGYGLGFTAYLIFMMRVAEGPHRTAHYAICTGFMALGMMLPGMAAGWLQETLGYRAFFIWVCLATLPALAAVASARRLLPEK
jgi:PAT family beta-lactamase induction signal transducer AmpG